MPEPTVDPSKAGSDFIICEGCGLPGEWDWMEDMWVHSVTRTPLCDEVKTDG